MTRFISAGTLTIGLIAIVFGLAGAYAVRMLLSAPQPTEPPRQAVATTVPLASTDLPTGRIIRQGDIGLVRMTGEEMREKEMPLELVMLSPDQIIGRRLLEPLQQGSPFLTTKVYLEGQGPEVAEMLKPGYRAVTINIREQHGGWVEPGAIVDVIFRSQAISGQGDRPAIPETTMTLIEGTEVLKVVRPLVTSLQAATGYVSRAPMITLAVTPEQANMLQVVQDRGDLSLTVSQPDKKYDTSALENRRLTLEELLGVEVEAVSDAEEVEPFTTEVYLRGSRSLNTFEQERLSTTDAPPPPPAVAVSEPDNTSP